MAAARPLFMTGLAKNNPARGKEVIAAAGKAEIVTLLPETRSRKPKRTIKIKKAIKRQALHFKIKCVCFYKTQQKNKPCTFLREKE